jgi:hypothetical protein
LVFGLPGTNGEAAASNGREDTMHLESRLITVMLLACLMGCTNSERTAEVPSEGPVATESIRVPGRTVFVPHAGVPFDGLTSNGVWCATFPLAWHALGDRVLKGKVDLGPPATRVLVDGMNARPFPEAALDPSSRIVEAGTLGDGVLDRIATQGREKFDLALPRTPLALTDPTDILAYAFLRKDLPFEVPFEPYPEGIGFAGADRQVPAFGLTSDSEHPDASAMRAQTSVLFHGAGTSKQDMALEIRAKGGKDVLILAAVPHRGSLEATWQGVRETPRQSGGPLIAGETLAVPKFHFDLTHRFAEFIGAPVLNPGFEDYFIVGAFQAVLFRLDEAGVLLEAEAALELKRSEEVPVPLRHFIFDRPFLIALREADAEEPYFLLWIANTDLMPQ